MTPSTRRNSLPAVLVSVSIIVAPFLSGAAFLMAGIGIYRLFHSGPGGEQASIAAAWQIIGPAWALFASAIVLGAVGFFAWRTLNRQDEPEAAQSTVNAASEPAN